MAASTSSKVDEGWNGSGRRDGVIEPLKPGDDALHIDITKRGMYEWWYFDAHLDSGHTLVAFFYAANPNPVPGVQGKSGVELVLLRPDGRKTQLFIPYIKTDFSASREKADVQIGDNYLKVDYSKGDLPVYEVHLAEKDIGFHLSFKAQVKGWKPGTGLARFGKLGYFAWVVPFPRASVEGTVRDGGEVIQVNGVGYHDHNWLNFAFQSIIDYWMWGRIYSEHYTISYAFIKCNKKMDHHAVRILMLAKGEQPILSTGEFDFIEEEFEYNEDAHHNYPRRLAIRVPGEMEVILEVQRILEGVDMLENVNGIFRFLAKKVLRMKPGYFRLLSDFKVEVQGDGKSTRESGTALHEIVIFKSTPSS